MLVLTRKRGDPGIRIGGGIWVYLEGFTKKRRPLIRIDVPAGIVVSRGGSQISSWPITMRQGGRIQIGENVYINMVAVDRGKIRLGIEAPYDVNIVRGELIDTPRKETTQPAE